VRSINQLTHSVEAVAATALTPEPGTKRGNIKFPGQTFLNLVKHGAFSILRLAAAALAT
jgi:hypothetical protein